MAICDRDGDIGIYSSTWSSGDFGRRTSSQVTQGLEPETAKGVAYRNHHAEHDEEYIPISDPASINGRFLKAQR
jgi:hypothetical protein